MLGGRPRRCSEPCLCLDKRSKKVLVLGERIDEELAGKANHEHRLSRGGVTFYP